MGLLYELLGEAIFELHNYPYLQAFTTQELNILKVALKKQLNTPSTSSVGRLFDAVASLTDICQVNTYEGEAAMKLEFAASSMASDLSYPFQVRESRPRVIDWQQTLEAILHDCLNDQSQWVAAKFQNTLVEMALNIAQSANQSNIVMSGGCFQNAYLVEKINQRLQDTGFKVFQHEKIPPNDGGLALGQIIASTYS